ncbi:MAG: TfoX/Sxy family DNA transformation protein [Rubrivivax sp.]
MTRRPGGEANHRPGAPSFRGLGPKSRAWLAEAGIGTPQALAATDPFEVYARIKARQPRAGINLLYALIGAVEDRDWREVARVERTGILLRLEEMGLLGRG